MNQSVVLCDNELTYVFHLQEYLDADGRLPCPVCIYTDTGILLREQGPGETLLLVISESEFHSEVAEQGYERILILNESGRMLEGPWPYVSKYQSMDHVLEAILQTAGAGILENAAQKIRHAGAMQLLGFFTPVSRCLQTSFALSMGQVLGEEHKVLYLNFECWPTIACRMNTEREGSIQDLLYLNECAREKVAARMEQIVCRQGRLDLILPMNDYTKLQAVSQNEWLSLLETIRQVSEYEYVLLDLSESVQGLLDILGQCSRVYTIERADAFARRQIECYEHFLVTHEAQSIAAATRYLELPVFPELPVAVADFSEGPLAGCAREELRVLTGEGSQRNG